MAPPKPFTYPEPPLEQALGGRAARRKRHAGRKRRRRNQKPLNLSHRNPLAEFTLARMMDLDPALVQSRPQFSPTPVAREPHPRNAVTSISIFISGSLSPATTIVAAGGQPVEWGQHKCGRNRATGGSPRVTIFHRLPTGRPCPALRRAGKGGAPLREAIARNADRHALDLAPVVEDIRARGAISRPAITAELTECLPGAADAGAPPGRWRSGVLPRQGAG